MIPFECLPPNTLEVDHDVVNCSHIKCPGVLKLHSPLTPGSPWTLWVSPKAGTVESKPRCISEGLAFFLNHGTDGSLCSQRFSRPGSGVLCSVIVKSLCDLVFSWPLGCMVVQRPGKHCGPIGPSFSNQVFSSFPSFTPKSFRMISCQTYALSLSPREAAPIYDLKDKPSFSFP